MGAERTFDLIDYGVGINAITQHPGRTNLILGGASDGMIYIWDIRKDKVPITAIDNHVASVTSVSFLPIFRVKWVASSRWSFGHPTSFV